MHEIFRNMDYLSLIKAPIAQELDTFNELFNQSLMHTDGLLQQALQHILAKGGKRMRPILMLLMARHCGEINASTYHAAVGLELLHTASLVHDDVVDEAQERRGQSSTNASFGNKVAVLVGDYVLSTCLLQVSHTENAVIFRHISQLGRVLSNGEILQLTNNHENGLSEQVYFDVIRQKTAALFEACCALAAISVGMDENNIDEIKDFGQNIGTIFQIRDDIFDYYDEGVIGKPTGNDMAEGKLTLPILYALNNVPSEEMIHLAHKVKQMDVTPDEIARLVSYAKQYGGIEYAMTKMDEYSRRCYDFIEKNISDEVLFDALNAYVSYMSQRNL